ncbi:ATP-binding protein [Helicobacter ailurogastricus]|uniref:ATP-binding protein n=1 Tax=Helicobacter ailurogastricus TaxID=1578720 RepID=UPI000CF196B0|nr:ATP-binding protein [Helicobacter ailurogastricus]
MNAEVIFIQNDWLKQADLERLEAFSAQVQELLEKQDYDFSAVKEVALMGVFDPKGAHKIQVKTGQYKPTKEEEVGISLLRSRLNHPIQESMQEGKFLGIGAHFYLAINYTKALQEHLNKQAQDKKAIKQEQENAPSLNLRVEEPRYSLEKIELDKKTKKGILEVITLVQKQDLIYEEWGFKEVDGIAKTIINFHGKPGTGKTMSAHIIAKELGKQIIHGNYADIESKFVGDAPKNLVAAFDLAQKSGAILFFDEADSFLGKRISNVTQSADQAVNSLRSELLKLLEERPVIVIFATNLLENYDKAFHSRILRSISFELPNGKQRQAIISKHIPTALYEKGMAQLAQEELETLSQISKGFSGREIKNAILNGLIRAAKEEVLPNFIHFKKAFKTAKKEFEKTHKEENKKESLSQRIKSNLKKGKFKTMRRKDDK